MSQTPEAIHRCCDLVLKGGITSGVVYPAAIGEIARRFHLVGIGGTSAGAIAAALAAAAEYRRRREGTLAGFEELERITRDLAAERGALAALFRPDASTRNSYRRLLRLLPSEESSSWWGRRRRQASRWGAGLRLALAYRSTLEGMRSNGFGLSSGMANGNPEGPAPLTRWLADNIDRVAGRDVETEGPLTFADLHDAPRPASVAGWLKMPWNRSIDLRCVSTCLTFGRPLEFPLATRIFGFDPEPWRRLFPERILEHLLREGEARESRTFGGSGKIPLPTDQLPVVVAARFSLSFPGLFSAVPLWAMNYQLEEPELREVWLSDGGITSNFPLHRFDALYPGWPTLGISLQYEEAPGAGPGRRGLRRDDEWVYLPDRAQDGLPDLWRSFQGGGSLASEFASFLQVIFSSAKDWHDNAYLQLPGFNDRFAEVWLQRGEGGLNLDMEPVVIERLIERGRKAGRQLAERFSEPWGAGAPAQMSWDGHHWARYRAAMAGLARSLILFRDAAVSPMPDASSLADLLADDSVTPRYPFSSAKRQRQARELTESLLQWVDDLEEAGNPFEDRAPRPPVIIGTRPRF